MRQIRVRIAPSPTGIPHIGNTRTALFNYLFAKHNQGMFLLRIEDTDRARIVAESEKAIYEILSWLGLQWDEEYKQSERLDIYKEHGKILQEKGLAYEDNGAIRFKMSKEGITEWVDAIGEKHISFENKTQEDFVIIKSDSFPTYNFANVVDDHLMQISHVIRGDEFISSTPKHIQLYEAFSWKHPVFAHLPVILGPDKTKLSKRHGAKSVLDYRNEGYLKEALLNFMVLLGWNPGGDREILSIEEMISLFDLKDVNTSSPVFDVHKLMWFNGYYIRNLSEDELFLRIKDLGLTIKDEQLAKKLIPLAQTRMNTLNDFYTLTKHFFEEPEIILDEKEKEVAKKLLDVFTNVLAWKKEDILQFLKQVLEQEKTRMTMFYKILTGKESGLPLPESLVILGKEKTIERLKRII